jgi:hypothetical protein
LDRLEPRPVKPRRPCELTGLAAERRAFAASEFRIPHQPKQVTTINPIPDCPDTVGLLGDDVNAAALAAEMAIRGVKVVLSGNRAQVDDRINETVANGFLTPLEAGQARERVRVSVDLKEFHKVGLVFVARGNDPFRLATILLPRCQVCLLQPTANQGDPQAPGRHDLNHFPYPRRLVFVHFRDVRRVRIEPLSKTDTDSTATLVRWLQLFDLEPTVLRSTSFPSRPRLPKSVDRGESEIVSSHSV